MSEPNSEHLQMAAEAAEKLIGVYPTIQASDPKVYAAGLVQLFSRYPEHLVAEAVDPVDGLPSLYDWSPTMKQVKEFLEPRWQNLLRQKDMRERFNRAKLPAPPKDEVAVARVAEGFKKLALDLKRTA